jgi:psiF repeat
MDNSQHPAPLPDVDAPTETCARQLTLMPKGIVMSALRITTAALVSTFGLSILCLMPAVSHAAPTREEAKVLCTNQTKSVAADARKDAMKACMKKNAPPSAQGQKMKTCSASFKATGKPSSERRAYMKTCLAK